MWRDDDAYAENNGTDYFKLMGLISGDLCKLSRNLNVVFHSWNGNGIEVSFFL